MIFNVISRHQTCSEQYCDNPVRLVFTFEKNILPGALIPYCAIIRARFMCKYFLSFPQKTCHQRNLRQTKCLLFDFWMIKLTKIPILPNFQVPKWLFCYNCILPLNLLMKSSKKRYFTFLPAFYLIRAVFSWSI